MTTRNEWIAETARIGFTHGFQGKTGRMAYEDFDNAIIGAKNAADALESANVAPWQTPPPAPTPSVEAESVAKVVKSAVKWCADLDAFVEADVAVMEGRLPYGGSDEADRRRESSETALVHEVRAYLARLDAKGGAK